MVPVSVLSGTFIDTGIGEMKKIVDMLLSAANNVSPRALPSYGTLLWFAQQVHKMNI